jgi:hypothetical protein
MCIQYFKQTISWDLLPLFSINELYLHPWLSFYDLSPVYCILWWPHTSLLYPLMTSYPFIVSFDDLIPVYCILWWPHTCLLYPLITSYPFIVSFGDLIPVYCILCWPHTRLLYPLVTSDLFIVYLGVLTSSLLYTLVTLYQIILPFLKRSLQIIRNNER